MKFLLILALMLAGCGGGDPKPEPVEREKDRMVRPAKRLSGTDLVILAKALQP